MFKKILRASGKTLLTLTVLAVLLGGLWMTKMTQFKQMAAAGEGATLPPTSVTTAPVSTFEWNESIRGVGNVVAVQGVTVTTETPGKVVEIHFESGQTVEKGDLLMELDSSIERAQLNSAIANAELAKINVVRSRELFEKAAIAKSELDTTEARFRDAEAQVSNLEAVLAKKVIRAPFSGRLGIRAINLGQYVGSGQAVVSLQSIDPVYVDLFIPQQKISKININYGVEVVLDGNNESKLTGKISAISSEVDSGTRNILVRATLGNLEEVLRPGMFVDALILQPISRQVIAVPSTSVLYAPFGNSVYVAEKSTEDDSLVAVQRIVRLGEARGDYVEIVEGLETDDEVVTSGAFKLRNGVKIIPKNEKSLEYSIDPKPQDA